MTRLPERVRPRLVRLNEYRPPETVVDASIATTLPASLMRTSCTGVPSGTGLTPDTVAIASESHTPIICCQMVASRNMATWPPGACTAPDTTTCGPAAGVEPPPPSPPPPHAERAIDNTRVPTTVHSVPVGVFTAAPFNN